jgi:hypothetical protein
MPPVRIVDRRIQVGDEQRSLLAGEVHFWRLDPHVWPAVLRAARDLGLEILSTYVCWEFHELSPGEFDFVGRTNPRRDLLGFLELARREGFWLLLRPGPYIYAEWRNSGIPERTVRWHRLHPEFQREAEVWMARVVEATRPSLATHRGPIVLWQADNEADPWTDVYGAQLGLAETPGLFQEFLAERYVQVAELNNAWNTSLSSFSAARAVSEKAPAPGYESRYLDVCRFRHWYATKVVRWTSSAYRRLGVDVPIYANTYASWSVQQGRELQTACDLVGPDVYPTARIAADPVEHRQVLDAIRYARSYAPLAFIPEFESGIWHGWHKRVGMLPATHYALIGHAVLQAGASGWNWYMLVNRDNWYMSPINELGDPRPDLAPVFGDLVCLFRELDPPSLAKMVDTAVTVDPLDRAANLAGGTAEVVLQALHSADIDYEFFDIETARLARPLVLYAGASWLSPLGQRHLVDYVEGGGTLVFFQTLPVADAAQQPLNLLGLRLPDGVTTAADPQRIRLELGDHPVELSSAAVYAYSAVPGTPLHAERIAPRPPSQEGGYAHVQLPIGQRVVVGYLEARGPGRVVVLGVAPTPDLLVALHAWLGVRVPSRAGSPAIHSALFARRTDHFLVLTNTAEHAVNARIQLDIDAACVAGRALRTDREFEVTNGSVLTAEVPPRSGTVLRLVRASPP